MSKFTLLMTMWSMKPKSNSTSSDWDFRGPCAIYHIPSENVPMKSEIFTKNVKEWLIMGIEILNVNRKCPIIKILILITAPVSFLNN